MDHRVGDGGFPHEALLQLVVTSPRAEAAASAVPSGTRGAYARDMVDTEEPRELPAMGLSAALREQEAEFYQALILLVRRMPPGTTIEHALASDEGWRIRQKWALKYGRQPPLSA